MQDCEWAGQTAVLFACRSSCKTASGQASCSVCLQIQLQDCDWAGQTAVLFAADPAARLRVGRIGNSFVCLQIQLSDCEWAGKNDCPHWRVILWAMGAFVVADSSSMVLLTLYGRGLTRSSIASRRRCAPPASGTCVRALAFVRLHLCTCVRALAFVRLRLCTAAASLARPSPPAAACVPRSSIGSQCQIEAPCAGSRSRCTSSPW